jgi:hypothetical protein
MHAQAQQQGAAAAQQQQQQQQQSSVPERCPQCGEGFGTLQELLFHVDAFHPENGQAPAGQPCRRAAAVHLLLGTMLCIDVRTQSSLPYFSTALCCEQLKE